MKILRKKPKNYGVNSKFTELEKQKLETLSKKNDITLSNLIHQLVEIGYKEVTKVKL